jgi:hypothetical protein
VGGWVGGWVGGLVGDCSTYHNDEGALEGDRKEDGLVGGALTDSESFFLLPGNKSVRVGCVSASAT